LPGDLLKLWRTRDPKGYHLEYGYSCMGYEIAGGLGAKMADPDRNVYVMVGDGSYLMLHTEIVTSIQEGYKLIIVLLDNHGFQCIRGLQESAGSPAFGNELRFREAATDRLEGPYLPIDFVANARSLGAEAFSADSAEALREALQRACTVDRTVLIYVPVDPNARVPSYEGWWDVPVAEVSAEAGVQAARTVYQEAKARQRLYT
jgi:3D-(3,5/4)-trihydroxycyclohexane-1,2-dione acylhydrolase (decyclizing)